MIYLVASSRDSTVADRRGQLPETLLARPTVPLLLNFETGSLNPIATGGDMQRWSSVDPIIAECTYLAGVFRLLAQEEFGEEASTKRHYHSDSCARREG